MSEENRSFFGFRAVGKEERTRLIRGVFSSVAGKYDLMNDLMSLGLHRLWKKRMIECLALAPGHEYLDVAGGTGDISMQAVRASARATICDLSPEMIAEGKKKAIDANVLHGINWVCGNAERLPFRDASFDRVGIAFGIRNVTNILPALSEFYRVLKPGGKFVCLEFSTVRHELLKDIYDAYSFNVIPAMGKMVTGDRDSYQYLVESIRKFPPPEEFERMIKQAGFANTAFESLNFGVVALHRGEKYA